MTNTAERIWCELCGREQAVKKNQLLGRFNGRGLIGEYNLCTGCSEIVSQDNSPDRTEEINPRERQIRQRQEREQRKRNLRMGSMPGAGPKGSQKTSYSELPEDAEALKWMYLEMRKNYQDTEARAYREKHDTWGSDEDTLEDYISKGWNRIRDLIGVFALLIFVFQWINTGKLTLLAQVAGAISATTLFDAWIRPLVDYARAATQDR